MTVDPSYMSVVSLMQTMPTTRRMRTTLIRRMVPSLSDVLLWPEASSATVPPALRDVVIDGRTGKMHEFGEDPESVHEQSEQPEQLETEMQVEVEVEVAHVHVKPGTQEPEPEPEQEQQPELDQQPEHAGPAEAGGERGAEHIDLADDRLATSNAQGAASNAMGAAYAEIAQAVEESKPDLQHPAAAAAAAAAAAERETLAEPQRASTANAEVSTVFTEESGEIEREQLEAKFATSLK